MLLSRNHPPSPALAPFVRRHYVFEAALPADFELIDALLSEFAFIRILLEGDWTGDVAGEWVNVGPVPLFGPNFQPFRVRVCGPFRVIGVALRPSGWHALFDTPAHEHADRMVALHECWGRLAERLHTRVRAATDDADVVAAIEEVLTQRIADVGIGRADPHMAAFESIARHDSTLRVADAADAIGLSVRQMERQCHASFGAGPKAVLRRSRFLDMASAVRGFTDPNADELMALRFADQSHKNREFRHFIGMTPGQFERTPTPLLTAGLKLRAEGVN